LWYRDLFNRRLSEFWIENYFSEKWKSYTEKETALLKDVLKKGVILDLCCGPGRHSIPLSSLGRVISFDLSKYLLSALREKSKDAGLYKNINLIEGDMKRLPFKSDFFDDIINLQTSFGYFSDEENELVLQEISRVLKPNGVFVLEVANPGWIMSNFQARGWDETDSFYALEERYLDWKTKRMRSRWILINKKDGEMNEILVDHRLYDLNELKELLLKAELKIISTFGSPEKEELHATMSRRILLVTRKQSKPS